MSIDLEKHRPLARLLVRLMGVFFVVEGVHGVISNGLDTYWRWRMFQRAHQEYQPDQALAWTIGAVVMLVAGLYLTFKGKMAFDAIFHERFEAPAVPCPECGYDLRATTAGKCPECGIELNKSPATPESKDVSPTN